jgi:hypothetical protein
MKQAYTAAGIEPPLEELLNDRIVQLIMRRDGIGPADVWRAVEAARSRPAARTQPAVEAPPGADPTLELLSHVEVDGQTTSPSG